MKRYALIVCVSFSFFLFYSQEITAQHNISPTHTHSHTEECEGHEPHKHHVGLAMGPNWHFEEGVLSAGFHAHYLYNLNAINPNIPLGFGAGAEVLIGEHMHYSVMPTLAIYPHKQGVGQKQVGADAFCDLPASPNEPFDVFVILSRQGQEMNPPEPATDPPLVVGVE